MWLHNFRHKKVSCNMYLYFGHLFPVFTVVFKSVNRILMWEVTFSFVYISCKTIALNFHNLKKDLVWPKSKDVNSETFRLNLPINVCSTWAFCFSLPAVVYLWDQCRWKNYSFCSVYCMYNHESPFSEYTESMTGQGLSAFFQLSLWKWVSDTVISELCEVLFISVGVLAVLFSSFL